MENKSLLELLKDKKLTQKELAKRLGVSAASVNQWVKGTSRPDHERLVPLSAELGIPVDMLLNLISNTVNDEAGQYLTGNVKSLEVSYSDLYTLIPFLSAKAQAGIPTMTYENCTFNLDEKYPVFVTDQKLTQKHLVIELIGDSMEPGILSGAILLCQSVSKDDIRYESGGIYAVLYANRLVIKRIKTNDINSNSTLTLWSDNDRYGHIVVSATDISCMWKVVMKVKESVR